MIKVEFSFSTIDELRQFLAPKVDTSFDVEELERQLAEPLPIEDPPLTLADLRQAILDTSNRGQSSVVRDLLTRYGVKKASELPENQWQAFHKEVVHLGC